MDLSSVVPNSTPPRLVNSQLVSLLAVGILNKFLFYLHYLFPLALKSPVEGVVK